MRSAISGQKLNLSTKKVEKVQKVSTRDRKKDRRNYTELQPPQRKEFARSTPQREKPRNRQTMQSKPTPQFSVSNEFS